MEHITLLLAIVVATALVFDFTNGFHDTANAMATTISTGALKPKTAVAMSATLNLVGAFLSVEVAKTISGGIVDEDGLRTEVIFAALVGAILWNLVTWLVGLPSSSSHALFGGLIGAAVMSAGWSSVDGGTVVTKILLPAVAAPLVAGAASMLATRLSYRVNRNVTDEAQLKSTARGYRAGQIASAGLVSLAHGTNDAQKTMGIITLALVTGGVLSPGSNPPVWVICSAGLAIALGTYFGGWRIIRTMGSGLTDLQPQQGFAAQTSAATVILASSHLGFSLSTTQSCSGAVMGAGLGRRGGTVKWSTATRMFVAWGLTLPAAGLVGAGAEFLTRQGTWGIVLVAALLVAGSGAIWQLSRREPVDHTGIADEPGAVATPTLDAIPSQLPGASSSGLPVTGLTATIPSPLSAASVPAAATTTDPARPAAV